MDPAVSAALAAARLAIDTLSTALAAPPVAGPPAPVVKPSAPVGKAVDWTLTGLATQAYFKATGRWVEIRVYSDGTREGPEIPAPTPDASPKPAEGPAPVEIKAPVATVPAAGVQVWSGLDKLRHHYGRVWEHDGQVDVASWAGEGFSPSGVMQKPKEDGQGYGIYTLELSGSKSNAPGKFACIWPADDVWRWEIDIVENDFDGNAIATLHWDGHTGHDQSEMKWLAGIRADERHVYETTWSRDLIVIKVDGVEKARFTEHVPRDKADGGACDGCLGVGTQPAWAAQAQTGDQVFTVHAASYRKLG